MIPIGPAGQVQRGLTGLMQDPGPVRLRQSRQSGRHGLVQYSRAQATSHHQQTRPVAASPVLFRGHGQDVLTHRVAGMHRRDRGPETAREGLQHGARKPRQNAIGQARHRILFMNHQRNPQQPGHDAAGSGDEPAHAEHHMRPVFQQSARGLPTGPKNPQRRRQPSPNALAADAADADPIHRETGLGHDSGFHPPAGAQPADLGVGLAQLPRHRQGGIHMPAGAAGHHRHPHT